MSANNMNCYFRLSPIKDYLNMFITLCQTLKQGKIKKNDFV